MDHLMRLLVGLLPVLGFLLVLVFMDSYKLVGLRKIIAVIGAGGLAALFAFAFNSALYGSLSLDFTTYSRYVSPIVEELLKVLVVVYLFRSHRIGFLVDAAILGFAVGAGFALVENFWYLHDGSGRSLTVWVVRGFGTAIMHGGVVAIFAIMSQALTERSVKINPAWYLPGLLVAVLLHSLFNHFLLTPIWQTIGTLMVLPPLLKLAFDQGAERLHRWLELDFDADARLIAMLTSGEFPETPIGRFLTDLSTKFEGPVVVDMLCYLRIYTELAIRAKAQLMAREHGIELIAGERTHAKLEELRYLEKSIGKTGRLAMKPFLMLERQDLWQMDVLAH